MKLNKRLTPYPVLTQGDDDYIDSNFDAHVEHGIEFSKLKVHIKFSLNNNGIKELIIDDKAKFVAHFECPLLSYRKMLTTATESGKIEIDLNEITNEIECSIFIVATQDIPLYYNEKFNWEYGTDGVDIEKGNILAIGPRYKFEIDRNKDGLKKLSDIISINQYDTANISETSVELDGDVIMIYVNEDIKNLYFIHGKNYLYNVISMIMVPAMIYILTRMKNSNDDLKDYKWFGVVEKLLQQDDIEVDQLRDDESAGKYSIYTIAQKIFKSPIKAGLKELNR